MPKQATGAAMMMRFGRRQQVAVGGIAVYDRRGYGLIKTIRHGQRLFDGRNQFRLTGQDAFHRRSRQTLHEWRVTRHVFINHCRNLTGRRGLDAKQTLADASNERRRRIFHNAASCREFFNRRLQLTTNSTSVASRLAKECLV